MHDIVAFRRRFRPVTPHHDAGSHSNLYDAVLGDYVKWRSRRRRWWWVLITKCQPHHALSIATDQYHPSNIHEVTFSTPKRCGISHWLSFSGVLDASRGGAQAADRS